MVPQAVLFKAVDQTLNPARVLLQRLNQTACYLGLIAALAELPSQTSNFIEKSHGFLLRQQLDLTCPALCSLIVENSSFGLRKIGGGSVCTVAESIMTTASVLCAL